MLKEFRFLFDLVLELPTYNRFCYVSWCEFLLHLNPLWVQMKILVRILCNEAHELKDSPTAFRLIRVPTFSFLPDLGVSGFLLSLFTDPAARNICVH